MAYKIKRRTSGKGITDERLNQYWASVEDKDYYSSRPCPRMSACNLSPEEATPVARMWAPAHPFLGSGRRTIAKDGC
jgi:hypothetical protein